MAGRPKTIRGVGRGWAAIVAALAVLAGTASGQAIDRRVILDRQGWWDNRDFDWYEANIPFFEGPEPEIEATYYYRWELLTKHLTYGSPDTGYTFTEFIDRPFWSGTYGAISCPAGHQLAEARWLRDARIGRDFARYWFRTPGAQPRNYSTWLADAIWGLHRVHPDEGMLKGLLPDLVRNYEGWERSHFDPKVGLFWQTGHDDGMEFNINSRQARDILRGAPAYRPTLNSYLWADARAIARVARLSGDAATSDRFEAKAAGLKENLQRKLWDPERRFFFPMSRQDEEKDGAVVKAGSLTYQTGRFAGDKHGRELIGYVPWQFGLPDPGFEAAWAPLMDPDGFFAPFGPTVTERHDPLFLVTKSCCWWSGQSWPYATTQTLVAMANLLDGGKQEFISGDDYIKLLRVYTKTQRRGGRPYIAEGADPDTGSWEGYDSPGHSDHYFHSAYNDLIVTGLVGLRPRDDETIEVRPLAPEGWDYFCLADVPYRGRNVSIAWDKLGTRYGLGKGLSLVVDGKTLATSPTLGRLVATLPAAVPTERPAPLVNYAVNNDPAYFPRATASFSAEGTAPGTAQDGNSWYHVAPPNRWTAEGSAAARDWLEIDFGVERPIREVRLYVLDDEGDKVKAPARIDLEAWDGKGWAAVPGQSRRPGVPTGHRANVIAFPELSTSKLRAVLTHADGSTSGLSEFEAWGAGTPPIPPAPPPPDNLATNREGRGFPLASASYTSRFDRVEMANDGVISMKPNPHNRWTAYESPQESDWLEIDFGRERAVGRVELHLYDDRGGVRAPSSYTLQAWDGADWREIAGQVKVPAKPAGGRANTVTFPRVEARKIRVVFSHASPARSGICEIEAWEE